ncbi:11527_t:CDS:2 [Funneliformis mosseae]|uniref:11527_t:CDS:1 n=1 Tax=Funneliformis mosseae TaxID=27381 RepID=A0A9N9ESW9_FUNMO|nr:11527_t:CDS:2 [Funneliformis mosseae]
MNRTKNLLNSLLDSSSIRSLFEFTEKSVLNPVLTLNFCVCKYTTSVIAFCFIVGTKIESVIVVKKYNLSDLQLWKINIPDDAKNNKFIKLRIFESGFHNEDTIIQELEGQKLIIFKDFSNIFNSSLKNICILMQ